MEELTRLAETKFFFKTAAPGFSLISGCLLPLKNSFIHRLSFRLKTRKASKNSESYRRFKEYTSLTQARLKQTLCSSLTGIWIIRLICHLLKGKFPCTAA